MSREVIIVKAAESLGYHLMIGIATIIYFYWLSSYVRSNFRDHYRGSRRLSLGGDDVVGIYGLNETLPWGLFFTLCTTLLIKITGVVVLLHPSYSLLENSFGWYILASSLIFILYWGWGWGVITLSMKDEKLIELKELLHTQRIKTVEQSTIYLLPIALLCSLSEIDSYASLIIFAASIIAMALHLVKTFFLFKVEKVSKLRWFLYLCTVEVAPILILVYFAVILASK